MTTFRVSPDQPSKIVDPVAARRRKMVKELKATADEYVKKEKDRLNAEAKSLQAILDGRAAGAGIQQLNTQMIAGVARSSLDAFLSPKGA
jgi:hypothetical protein